MCKNSLCLSLSFALAFFSLKLLRKRTSKRVIRVNSGHHPLNHHLQNRSDSFIGRKLSRNHEKLALDELVLTAAVHLFNPFDISWFRRR